MNPEELYNQLLSQGMTEQQIADLVAKEIMRQRAEQRAETPSLDQSDSTPLADQLLSTILADSDSPGSSSPIDDNSHNSEGTTKTREARPTRKGKPQSTLAELVAEKLHENTPPLGTQAIGGDRRDSRMESIQYWESFAGPLPPPHLAQQYEDIVPGFTDRCLAIVESDSSLRSDIWRQNSHRLSRGQTYAFLFALTAIAVSLGFAWLGYAKSGVTLAATTVASVVGLFLYRERAKSKSNSALAKTEDATTPELEDSRSE